MFVFLFTYISSFIYSLVKILKGKTDAILFFFIFGLPVYITANSLCLMYGFGSLIPVLQSFKELIVLITLALLVFRYNYTIKLNLLDKLIVIYFVIILIYAIIPLGPLGFVQRLIALKSIAFFPFVYFIGRHIPAGSVSLNKYFHFFALLAIAAAAVVLFEVITNQHLQTHTGYANFNYKIYKIEPTGHYGLSWTFEAENGLKRFASFFSMPLEHAAATVVSIAVILATITLQKHTVRTNRYFFFAIIATCISIIFALSRAAFASYLLLFYVYARITNNKKLLFYLHAGILIAVVVIAFFIIKGDLYSFILSTIDFSNSSSQSHIVDWLLSINTLTKNPFGVGLGTAGNVANTLADSIGGENELLIIGVQTGAVPMLLYAFIYGYVLYTAYTFFKKYSGNTKTIALMVLLLKIGLILATLTSELESYIYISYITWFFTGFMFNVKDNEIELKPALV